jgi:hypothetical protein
VSVAAYRRHDYAGVVICGGDTSRPANSLAVTSHQLARARLARDGVGATKNREERRCKE